MIKFTWDYLRKQFESSIETGHEIITVKDFFSVKLPKRLPKKFHINRVDVDFSMEKAERLASMFNSLNIVGTFFVRLHEYNLLSYKNYRILKFIQDSGHEIGLHTELKDLEAAWGEDIRTMFAVDIDLLEDIINEEIHSCADHQDNRTPYVNVKPTPFYRYDADNVPDDIITVTDSNWTDWKSYLYGKNWTSMSIAKAALRYDKIYTIIHPCTYYERIIFDD